MKRRPLYSAVLAFHLTAICSSPLAHSEETSEPSILFVNALGEKGRAFLLVDDQDANPSGFGDGAVTGWVNLPVGKAQIVVEHQPWGKVPLELELAAGDAKAILLHPVLAEPDRPGRPERLTMGALVIDCASEGALGSEGKGKKRRLIALNATMADNLQVKVGEETVTLKKLQPTGIQTIEDSGFLNILNPEVSGDDSGPLLSLNMEDKRMHWLVFYHDQADELKAVEFALGAPEAFIDR